MIELKHGTLQEQFIVLSLLNAGRVYSFINSIVRYLHTLQLLQKLFSNIYTMGCPSVRGDNLRALASGLSYVQVDKHGITILYHLH